MTLLKVGWHSLFSWVRVVNNYNGWPMGLEIFKIQFLCPANESTLMICPFTNIEWSPPFWVSFHLLQVGANGIAHPNITHHAFFCKLTLCSSRHFAPMQHFAPHRNGIVCMLEVILNRSYNLSFLLQLVFLNTTTKHHVPGSFCASGSLLQHHSIFIAFLQPTSWYVLCVKK
jgi:hypothetical protein